MPRQYLLFLWLITGCLHAQFAAQQTSVPTGATTVLKADTRSVILDVLVTDASGHPVTGLTRSDFLIREDNTPQETRSFEAISPGAAPSESTPRTILLLDTMNTRFEDTAFARYSIDRLLHHSGAQLDHPTALYVLTSQGLEIAQPLTRNPAAIDAALRAVPASLPWRLSNDRDSMLDRINLSVTALRQIALANLGVPGHKNLVWISPGFPLWSALNFNQTGRQRVTDQLTHLSNQLLEARISIDSVDPRGFLPPVTAELALLGRRQQQQPQQNNVFNAYLVSLGDSNRFNFGDFAIQTLAGQTGGHIFYGRNDVDVALAASIRNAGAYYTLSYAPANRAFHGEFRKVQISLAHPSGLQVKTRDGYYALADDPSATATHRFDELGASLFAPLDYHAIPILLTDARRTGKTITLSVRLLVPSVALSWQPDAQGSGLVSTLMLATADRNRNGKWRQNLVKPYHVTLPAGVAPSCRIRPRGASALLNSCCAAPPPVTSDAPALSSCAY